MVFPVPIDEFSHARFDRGRRFKTDGFFEPIDVRVGSRDVTRLHVHQVPIGLASQRLFQRVDEPAQFHRAVVTDVVDPERGVGDSRIRFAAVEFVRRVGDAIAGPFDAGDDVVDVGEIATHPAVVEHVDRFAPQDPLGEDPHRHVGSAPRAIDGEEPQPRRRQSVQVAVRVGHQLVGLLRRRVQRQRMVDAVRFGKRHLRPAAVNAAAAGVRQVRRAGVSTGLEKVRERDDVALDVGVRIDQRIPNAGLRGQVHDAVERVIGEQPIDGFPVGQIAADVDEVRVFGQDRRSVVLERNPVVVVPVVDPHDPVAPVQQPPGEVEADEAGGPGDEVGLGHWRREIKMRIKRKIKSRFSPSSASFSLSLSFS